MATRNAADDATYVCSVCLEPYKGRNPKILPCFHTLCLPCLTDLEQHHTTLSDTKDGQDDDGDNPPLTFSCPTCRAVITVPPGGVTQFQANFYLNDETLTCDICDLGKEATYNCPECSQNMCDLCQRCHNKFLPSHKVQPLTFSCQQSSQINFEPAKEDTITQHLAVLEAALVTMREEEDTLQRERQEVTDVIRRRADTVRALVTQAEERSQRALTEVSERLKIEIQEEMGAARKIHGKIFQLIPQEGDTSQATLISRKLQTVLLSDENFQLYQQRCSRGIQTKIMLHQSTDVVIDLKIIEDYIGTVCGDKQPAGETSNVQVSESLCTELQSPDGQWKAMPVTPKLSDTTKLSCDIGHREEIMTNDIPSHYSERPNSSMIELGILKEEISNLQMDVAVLKEKDSKAEQNIRICQEKLESVEENISMKQEIETVKAVNCKLQTAIDSIQQESSSIKSETNKTKEHAEKNIRICQEKLESVEEDLSKTKKVTTSMKQEIETVKAGNCKLQTAIDSIQQESSSIKRETNKTKENAEQNIRICQEKFESVQEDLSRTKKVTTSMKKEIETVKAGNCKLQTAIDSIQKESSSIKRETNKTKEHAEQNIRIYQEKLESVQEDLSRTAKVTTSMKQEIETVKAGNCKLQTAIDSIQQESSSIKRETNKTKEHVEELGRDLRRFKEKSTFMVAFDVSLSNDTTVDEGPNDIVLSDVNCNVGEAYNKNTGIFIAPVTGIYFFMARTVKVKTPDLSIDINVDGHRVAESLHASGPKADGSCVVHLVQKLSQGQRVSLSSYTWSQAILRRSDTSFSGVLVQPELDLV